MQFSNVSRQVLVSRECLEQTERRLCSAAGVTPRASGNVFDLDIDFAIEMWDSESMPAARDQRTICKRVFDIGCCCGARFVEYCLLDLEWEVIEGLHALEYTESS